MNKEKLQVFLCGVAVGLVLLLLCGSALADATTRQLTATYNNIKIYVDGELISPKDVNGKPTEPFIVEGSTYLPVRAVAEALGKPVEWDDPSKSVYIGKIPQHILDRPTNPGMAKIAIITNEIAQNEEEYRSAQELVTKYGSDKIIHRIWPTKFLEEREQMVRIAQQIASDKDVKALIINPAIFGALEAVDKLLETRDDMFLVAVQPVDDPSDIAKRFDLIFAADEITMGPAMVQQAKKMGAKTFVHLSFPRHMSYHLISSRHELIKEECAKLGINFVTYTIPDPMGDIGQFGAHQVMLEEIPKLVSHYGKDTAFFCTNCGLQIPLIKAVVESGGIYPQQCCPSPLHGFPLALGLVAEGDNYWYGMGAKESMFDKYDSMESINAENKRIIKAKGMSGRVSTWPVPFPMLSTNVAATYAFKWIRGEVQKQGIDKAALTQCIKEYAGVECFVRTLGTHEADSDIADGEFPNWVFVREDYITY